jgi:phosphoglycolate phosphatase
MIASVVFDFDGTLVDSNAIKRQGFFEVVAAHAGGRERMQRILDRVTGDRYSVFAAYVADAAGAGQAPAQSAAELVRAYGDRVDELVGAAREMPGATQLLKQLRERGRRLYLSSATPVTSLRGIVEQRGWLPLFDELFGSPSNKRETLQRVRSLAGNDSRAIAVVGDGVDDRDSAASIGCAFFSVGEARGARASERVFTLPELLDVLLNPHEQVSRP